MTEMERYNHYVEQEDRAVERLETLVSCLNPVFDHIYRYGERFDRDAVMETLLTIHEKETIVRLELLHLRLEKAYLAYVLNSRKPQG
ncbi:hypothetical protein [Paenibacillus sp. R14(2021)]|uniref:hypothetical protein n=1 Tax=Paenibacillus sp. R14(2021) TaxID=2859228 RepID=UPI001C61201F|nr:hypothetical protein [Paenibacillus sp. R14(2021)]